jgi:predicted nuclease of predicted toxin-antitoxin system
MRLCANENLSEEAIAALRQAGHDVLWIREAAPGASDRDVLARAQTEGRLLLTFDKDFGELVFREGAKSSRGIILLCIAQQSAVVAAERIVKALASRTDWEWHFSVVEDATIRMRQLP